jgi:hypothetical protein
VNNNNVNSIISSNNLLISLEKKKKAFMKNLPGVSNTNKVNRYPLSRRDKE